MTVFRELSARERIEPTLAARIEQLAHPNNTFDARARAKQLLDQFAAEACQPIIERVRALHRVSTLHDVVPGRKPYCENCRFTWPCPTIQALEQP